LREDKTIHFVARDKRFAKTHLRAAQPNAAIERRRRRVSQRFSLGDEGAQQLPMRRFIAELARGRRSAVAVRWRACCDAVLDAARESWTATA